MNLIDMYRAAKMRNRPPKRLNCAGCHHWGPGSDFCQASHTVDTCTVCCPWLGVHPDEDFGGAA